MTLYKNFLDLMPFPYFFREHEEHFFWRAAR